MTSKTNEKGLSNIFSGLGINNEASILELIDNSIDAKAKNINITISNNSIQVPIKGKNITIAAPLLIIEDDGIGIAKSCFMGHDEETSDDHFGINIMRDRAKKIDGDLKIESEPGEGVRIILRFSKKLENS